MDSMWVDETAAWKGVEKADEMVVLLVNEKAAKKDVLQAAEKVEQSVDEKVLR